MLFWNFSLLLHQWTKVSHTTRSHFPTRATWSFVSFLLSDGHFLKRVDRSWKANSSKSFYRQNYYYYDLPQRHRCSVLLNVVCFFFQIEKHCITRSILWHLKYLTSIVTNIRLHFIYISNHELITEQQKSAGVNIIAVVVLLVARLHYSTRSLIPNVNVIK